jgi:hypothetical protein
MKIQGSQNRPQNSGTHVARFWNLWKFVNGINIDRYIDQWNTKYGSKSICA